MTEIIKTHIAGGGASGGGGAPAGEAYTKAQSDARFAKKEEVTALDLKVGEMYMGPTVIEFESDYEKVSIETDWSRSCMKCVLNGKVVYPEGTYCNIGSNVLELYPTSKVTSKGYLTRNVRIKRVSIGYGTCYIDEVVYYDQANNLVQIDIPETLEAVKWDGFQNKAEHGIVNFVTPNGKEPYDYIYDKFIGWELYINGEHIGTITPKAEAYYYAEEQQETHDFYLGDGYNGTYLFSQEASDSLYFMDTKPFEGKIIKSIMSNRGNEGVEFVVDGGVGLSYKEQKPIEWIDVEFE